MKVSESEMVRGITSILITELELEGFGQPSYEDRLAMEKKVLSVLRSLDDAGYYFGKRKGAI